MTAEQFGGLIRTLVALGSGWAIGKGFGDATTWVTIAAGLAGLATAAWSFWSKVPAKP